MTNHLKPAIAGSVFAAAMLLAAPATASGNAADGIQAMKELNLIVLGNLSANGQEVEGKTFVGGNVSGSGTNWGIGNATQSAAESDRKTLTVNGNNSNSGSINNGATGATVAATSPGALIGGNSTSLNMNAAGGSFDVGGNLSGNTNLRNGQVINVGGSASGVNGTTGATVNAGGAISGNRNGATFNANLGAGWNAADTSAVTAAELAKLDADVKALSAALAGLTIVANPSSITAGGQGPIFNAVDGGNGYALFDFAPAQFGNEINFNTNNADMTIIVNVSGTNINWQMNPMGGYNGSLNQSIIWNFYEAEIINFQRMVHGSVLAPFAKISNNGPLEGSVVAKIFNMGGEVHLGTFNGDTPFFTSDVPEPATWALLIAGFGLVGLAARRRRPVTVAA